MATGDHQASALAQQPANDVTLGDVVNAIKGQAQASHRPSHPPPLSRLGNGDESSRYIPTPSLDGRNVTAVENYEAHAGYVQCALDAFNTCYEGLQRLSDAREQVKKDPSKTEANQILIVAAEAEKLQDRMTRAMDSAHKRLSDGIKTLDDSLNAPLTAKADTTLGREVRDFVRVLSTEKRHAFLNEALNQKDVATLHAVLGAQPFLSGITPEMKAHFTRQLHEQQQPEISQRLRVMRKALALVESRGPLILIEIPKVLGADSDMVKKLRSAKSAAEQALLLINPAA